MTAFKILLAPLQKKIYLLVGRAILTAIDNSGKTQTLQVSALSGETITDIERFQNYGFESTPVAGAEVANIFLNGNRDNGIAVSVHDKRYRPTLGSGEVAIYNKESGHIITLKTGGILEVLTPTEIKADTVTMNLTATDIMNLAGATNVNIGDVVGVLQKLVNKLGMDVYNTHTHPETGGNTGVPNQAMVEDTDTTVLTVAN